MSDAPLAIRSRRTAQTINGRTLPLLASDLAELLPHRGHFALLDRVDSIEPGVRATGRKFVARNDPLLEGHFPGRPIVPGVLLIEILGQLSGIVLWSMADPVLPVGPVGSAGSGSDIDVVSDDAGPPAGAPAVIGVLAGVKKFRFVRLIEPGEIIDLESRLTGRLGGLTEFHVVATVAGERAAEGAVQIAFRS